MSKLIKIIFASFAAAAIAVFVGVLQVQAVENLVVDFEEIPLFSEANLLPGSSITRSITVTNNSDGIKDIIIEAINTSDPDGLGDLMDMVIKEGATEFFSDTMASFFSSGEISLSSISGSGGSTDYDLTVTLDEAAGNDLQGKSLGFDILIGFQGEGGGNGAEATGGGGGGGGGGGSPPGLVIPDELVVVVEIGETSATIEWLTTHFSTSQVVYSADGEPHSLDLGAPNYGYANSFPTPEDSTKVTAHSVTVTGLTPGTTYFFRVLSHASPVTVSREHGFITLVPTIAAAPISIPEEPSSGSPAGIADPSGIVRGIAARGERKGLDSGGTGEQPPAPP